MFLGNRARVEATSDGEVCEVQDAAVGLRVGWYRTAAMERGNENWRNNGLEATIGNNSDAIWPSPIALLVNVSGGDDEMLSHSGRRFGRKGSGGREKYCCC